MQGEPELGGESARDVEERGRGSLHQVAEGRRECPGRVRLSRSSLRWDAGARGVGAEGRPPCPTRGPDPGELSGAWGEFKSFQESPAKCSELLQRPAEPRPRGRPPASREHGSRQSHQGGLWTAGTAADPPSEPAVSYENIFRFAFQEVTVKETTEDISVLDHFLEANKEENPGLSPIHRLCSESRKLWRNLQSAKATPLSQRLWSGSHCQENLFLVLGVDVAQKSPSGSQGHILQGPGHQEPEELLAVSSLRRHHCEALIQTKPPGMPHCGQGSLVTYSLFLKTPLHGNGRYITIPQKKVFAARNLKMTFFNNGIC